MDSDILKEEIVELTRELVKSPSVNPPAVTSGCAEIILDKFKQNDIDAEIVEGKTGLTNVVGRLTGKHKGKVLLLNGHIDVVPPGEGWSVDPFGAKIIDGRIHGRGTVDMKAGIACMLMAMIAFKRCGVAFGGELIFTAVADEETGSEYGTRFLLENKIIGNADFAIVAEPTNLKVMLGNKGLRWIDILIKGKAAHAGRPHLGVNAISYAAKLVEAINSMKFQKRNDAFEVPVPTISITLIQGGSQTNIIPDTCKLTIDRRMIPGETTETITNELDEIMHPLLEKESELGIEVGLRPNCWDPYLISKDEPIVQVTVESVREIMGKQPEILGKGACTDASHLYHMAGIPAVLFGPGNEQLSHKVDESVSIEDLTRAVQVFLSVFHRLMV